MKRREFITLLGGAAAAWPLPLGAQTVPPAVLRVGAASPTPRNFVYSFLQPFEQRMAALGYVEGKNFILDFDDLGGRPGRYGAAMQELVSRKPDVLLAYGPEAALKAALASTKTIPIVMAAIDYDPLALGYISSLARPAGNVTGLYLQQIELAAKRIEMLRDAFPAMKGATVFWDALSADQWQATKASADKFGLQLTGVELRDYPYDYEKALAQVPAEHRRFLMIMTSPFFARDREPLAKFSMQQRIGSMFVFREYADLGGLMTYGPNRNTLSRRIADYVHRIARGAKPGDLPIERPATFELVINLKTAKLLGLEFSQATLLRADDVLE
jgi:putative ABC transport system substrate-binding protein